MFAGSTETVVNVSYDLFFLKLICISCQKRPEKKPLRLVKKYEIKLTEEWKPDIFQISQNTEMLPQVCNVCKWTRYKRVFRRKP